ncbi:alanine--tRNA ligase [Vulcanimicrobium alpinum]|uniref:Alanine--tRNA ligase n=1 Tax=Vulcanimicrobium alpinum TaxID=3016050 RepID=A0AAN2CBD8_UNVUL|nr:alanine--tRNA ligase [Vulcanimicrobium alpinum]BDE08126.1 alanine--tRNA ligase [Vulcanimicrobium alpinum]
MTSQELRQAFIDYFVRNGHAYLPSASLIPDEMSTTLFTIAGMEQFVPVFLGDAPAPAPRAVTVQRCLRVAGAKSDIENVGRTGRHGTFLEMLGNFSFGDYYKSEAIRFAWEFLTGVLTLDPAKLYVTVHTSDDEAQRLWENEVGLDPARISRWDEDNFWTMGPTGPCGPCSEIFYDTGAGNALGPDDDGPNKGNRFVEIWNVVFQQYNRGADGKLSDLPRKAIDTGAGFERMLAVANGKVSMYETDLFTDLIAAQPAVGATSLAPAEQLVRRRIIADHARAATFLIADGVYPSNTERGFVLRFLIRRAIRNGRLLGYPREFLADLAAAVVASLESGYPELRARLVDVQNALRTEEAGFLRTLDRGSELLEREIDDALASGTQAISGADAFVLHDTYGFPYELTREIASERGVAVDAVAFEQKMTEQRERARADAAAKRAMVTVTDVPTLSSAFEGYGGLEAEGEIRAILVGGAPVEAIEPETEAQLLLDRTAFYAEKGGQVGDRGRITHGDAVFEVSDTQYVGEAIAHHGRLVRGTLAVGDPVSTSVYPEWREEIRRHHTSAHLLQRALKDVLGEDVMQAGSWVGIDRMRFDFRSSSGALTPHQKRAVTQRVNELIRDDLHQHMRELPFDEAKQTGAIMMAGEKYGDRVRVVQFGPSVEFCGGTHAHTTGELGMFVIVSESSIGSGVRRIEAVVSKAAERYVEQQQETIATLSESLAAKPDEIVERVERLQGDVRDLQRALAEIKSRLAAADAASYVDAAEVVHGVNVVASVVREANAEALRSLGNAIRARLRSGVVALVGVDDGTASLFVSASDDAVKAGVHAGNLVKLAAPLVGGKGGGAPAQAQGGGKDPGGAEAALAAMRAALHGVNGAA